MICSSQTVRLVSHCFTSRTSRTGRVLVYTPQVPLVICSSQTVRLVNHKLLKIAVEIGHGAGEGIAYGSLGNAYMSLSD